MWIAIIAGGVILFLALIMYNSLISKKNQAENAFATIDTQLKKRYDLIPNLVSTVKGYAKHEASLLKEVTELRAKATSGKLSTDEAVDVNNKIGRTLGDIMVAVENYPELKANENFLHLQRTLNELEEQISAARRAFNAAVTDFNNAIEMVPTNIMANLMGYKKRRLFEIPEGERRRPDVKDAVNR